jgi:hypothetical protein
MTLLICDSEISSDRTGHTARLAPGQQHAWEVSWLPGRLMDRNTAITAMVLADVAGPGELHAGHRLWPHVEGWAAELGLTAPEAVARSSRAPASITDDRDATARPSDPEAAS